MRLPLVWITVEGFLSQQLKLVAKKFPLKREMRSRPASSDGDTVAFSVSWNRALLQAAF
jgi:hypothetical protein